MKAQDDTFPLPLLLVKNQKEKVRVDIQAGLLVVQVVGPSGDWETVAAVPL